MAKKKKISPQERQRQRLDMLLAVQTAMGLTKPGPIPFTDPLQPIQNPGSCPVLISIDLEIWEVDNSTVTEIGLSIFDATILPRDLQPGDRGKNLWNYIYSEHIRIMEGLNLTNRQYVSSCPENFDFGDSIIVHQSEVRDHVLALLIAATNNRTRPLYIVGHDVARDEDILSNLIDTDITSLAPEFQIIDTQTMWPLLYEGSIRPSLSKALVGLDIEYRYLHNGGNDALYSLWVCLALAVTLKESDKMDFKKRDVLYHFPAEPVADPASFYDMSDW